MIIVLWKTLMLLIVPGAHSSHRPACQNVHSFPDLPSVGAWQIRGGGGKLDICGMSF